MILKEEEKMKRTILPGQKRTEATTAPSLVLKNNYTENENMETQEKIYDDSIDHANWDILAEDAEIAAEILDIDFGVILNLVFLYKLKGQKNISAHFRCLEHLIFLSPAEAEKFESTIKKKGVLK